MAHTVQNQLNLCDYDTFFWRSGAKDSAPSLQLRLRVADQTACEPVNEGDKVGFDCPRLAIYPEAKESLPERQRYVPPYKLDGYKSEI